MNPKKDLEALTSTNQQPDTTTTVQTTKKDLEALTTTQTPDTTITVQVLPDTTITVQQLNAQLQNDISQHKAAEQSLHNAAEQEVQKAAEHAVHIPNVNHMNQKPNNILNIKDSAVDGQNVDVGDVPGVPKQMRPPVPDDQMQMGYKQHDDKNKSIIDHGGLNVENPLDVGAQQIDEKIIHNVNNNMDENKDKSFDNNADMQNLQIKEPILDSKEKDSNDAVPSDNNEIPQIAAVPLEMNPGQEMNNDGNLQAPQGLQDEDQDDKEAADEDDNYEDEEDEMEDEDGDRYEDEEKNIPHGGEN